MVQLLRYIVVIIHKYNLSQSGTSIFSTIIVCIYVIKLFRDDHYIKKSAIYVKRSTSIIVDTVYWWRLPKTRVPENELKNPARAKSTPTNSSILLAANASACCWVKARSFFVLGSKTSFVVAFPDAPSHFPFAGLKLPGNTASLCSVFWTSVGSELIFNLLCLGQKFFHKLAESAKCLRQ